MAFVSDASVVAAWVLPDEQATLADRALERLEEETAKVPDVFWHELRNLLLSAERRGRIAGGYAETCMVRLRRLRIQRVDETDDGNLLALARAHHLTVYDASYLALAIREECALVSLDRRLNEAAAAEGVTPFA
ncbi:MAG: type II toxin-antitoxin system VapC family toxin [Alphaproteobacteria bacterium]|nr:type II toxin-antitoxin system VapC family toxin [Alphaproteobacteria bacterium]MCY4608562.1 type II toxin-antitoxin system VapC family toxin [bacterium]